MADPVDSAIDAEHSRQERAWEEHMNSSNQFKQPIVDGLYAVEVYFGWKILAWRDGQWWHPEHTGRWTASEPHQWVGPLPDRIGAKPAIQPKMEFDL